jgi:hypothetical protein
MVKNGGAKYVHDISSVCVCVCVCLFVCLFLNVMYTKWIKLSHNMGVIFVQLFVYPHVSSPKILDRF